jgi:DNA repair exonuclease SbcCD nuclease subunit
MDNEIKILLTSDIHIGAGDGGSPLSDESRISTLRKILNSSLNHDMLLIAGDLIQADTISDTTLARMKTEISSAVSRGAVILYTPGSSDLINGTDLHSGLDDALFTRIFNGDQPVQPFEFMKGSEKIKVTGSNRGTASLIPAEADEDDKTFRIALLYAQFESCIQKDHKNIFSMNKTELKDINCDFYALGSYHNFRIFKSGGRIIGAYPGTPEPYSTDETGDRFALSFTVSDGKIATVKRLIINTASIINREIDCSRPSAYNDLKKISESERSSSVLLNLSLSGSRSFSLDNPPIFNQDDWHRILINDKSVPGPETGLMKYMHEDSFRGEFIRTITARINDVQNDIPVENIYTFITAMIESDTAAMEAMLCSLKNA